MKIRTPRAPENPDLIIAHAQRGFGCVSVSKLVPVLVLAPSLSLISLLRLVVRLPHNKLLIDREVGQFRRTASASREREMRSETGGDGKTPEFGIDKKDSVKILRRRHYTSMDVIGSRRTSIEALKTSPLLGHCLNLRPQFCSYATPLCLRVHNL